MPPMTTGNFPDFQKERLPNLARASRAKRRKAQLMDAPTPSLPGSGFPRKRPPTKMGLGRSTHLLGTPPSFRGAKGSTLTNPGPSSSGSPRPPSYRAATIKRRKS